MMDAIADQPPSTIYNPRSIFRARGSQQTHLAWDEETPGAAPGRATIFQDGRWWMEGCGCPTCATRREAIHHLSSTIPLLPRCKSPHTALRRRRLGVRILAGAPVFNVDHDVRAASRLVTAAVRVRVPLVNPIKNGRDRPLGGPSE